jgi:hypothetical protein
MQDSTRIVGAASMMKTARHTAVTRLGGFGQKTRVQWPQRPSVNGLNASRWSS